MFTSSWDEDGCCARQNRSSTAQLLSAPVDPTDARKLVRRHSAKSVAFGTAACNGDTPLHVG